MVFLGLGLVLLPAIEDEPDGLVMSRWEVWDEHGRLKGLAGVLLCVALFSGIFLPA